MDYLSLARVTLIAAVKLDMVSSLEKIQRALGRYYAVNDLVNIFISISVKKEGSKQFAFA